MSDVKTKLYADAGIKSRQDLRAAASRVETVFDKLAFLLKDNLECTAVAITENNGALLVAANKLITVSKNKLAPQTAHDFILCVLRTLIKYSNSNSDVVLKRTFYMELFNQILTKRDNIAQAPRARIDAKKVIVQVV